MDMQTIDTIASLKLEQGAWLITKVESRLWGKELTFHALYDVTQPATQFRLIFRNCRRVNWELIDVNVDEHDTTADVMGMDLGEDQHRKPAVINAGIFEIAITYGEMVIEKDW
jgi:hypothetical protein